MRDASTMGVLMPGHFKDMVGRVFRKLTILERVGSSDRPLYRARCDCGAIVEVKIGSKGGFPQSCGCDGGGRRRSRRIFNGSNTS